MSADLACLFTWRDYLWRLHTGLSDCPPELQPPGDAWLYRGLHSEPRIKRLEYVTKWQRVASKPYDWYIFRLSSATSLEENQENSSIVRKTPGDQQNSIGKKAKVLNGTTEKFPSFEALGGSWWQLSPGVPNTDQWRFPKSWGYPLVNIQKTIENHHVW